MTKEEELSVGQLPKAAFSTRGKFAPQGPLAGFGSMFDCHSWGRGGGGAPRMSWVDFTLYDAQSPTLPTPHNRKLSDSKCQIVPRLRNTS